LCRGEADRLQFQDIYHTDAHAANTGPAAALLGIDCDPISQVGCHLLSPSEVSLSLYDDRSEDVSTVGFDIDIPVEDTLGHVFDQTDAVRADEG
jgi:hypothetical protein